MPNHLNKIVLGAGKLYFDPFDDAGAKTGEEYLGDTPGFTVNVTTNNIEVMGNDTAVAELLANIATSVTRSANIVCQDMTASNLGRFMIGEVSAASQGNTPVTDHPINGVLQGRWYQIGVSATFPMGARDIGTVSVADAVPTTYDIGDDYELDLALGRIYIVPGGGIADGTDLLIDYTPATAAWERITASDLVSRRGALRYIADNTRGPNRDLYGPQVELRPGGDLAWKSRDTVQQLTFAAGFEKPDSGAALYIEGRPV